MTAEWLASLFVFGLRSALDLDSVHDHQSSSVVREADGVRRKCGR
jgi:hypothetical protein